MSAQRRSPKPASRSAPGAARPSCSPPTSARRGAAWPSPRRSASRLRSGRTREARRECCSPSSGPSGRRGPTMLASAPARELEEGLREARASSAVAARGRLCWLGLPATEEALGDLPPGARGRAGRPGWRSCTCPRGCGRWPWSGRPAPAAGLLRADLPADRALAALAVAELRERRLPARVAARPLGRVASRRALAGPGGRRRRRQRGSAGSARGLARPRRRARRGAGPGAADGARRGLRDPVRGGACWRRSAARSPGRRGRSGRRTWSRSPERARCETTSRGCSPRRGCPAERRTRATWTGASTWRERLRPRARPPPGTASTPTGCASRSPTPAPSRPSGFAPRSPPRSTPRRLPGQPARAAGDRASGRRDPDRGQRRGRGLAAVDTRRRRADHGRAGAATRGRSPTGRASRCGPTSRSPSTGSPRPRAGPESRW